MGNNPGLVSRKTESNNETWNPETMRTYAPLIIGIYYRPKNVYKEYYSVYYGLTYYDGYGWNFYSQEGNYYDGRAKDSEGAGMAIVIVVITVILCICFCVIYALCNNKEAGEEEEDEEFPEEAQDVEEVEIEEIEVDYKYPQI